MNIKKIKPLFNRVLVTAETYSGDEKERGLIVKSAGTLKEYQKVVTIGSSVRDVKVGDIVLVNPSRYAQKQYEDGSMKDGVIKTNRVVRYNFNIVSLDGVPHLLLFDSDIEYVVEEYEEDNQDTPSIIVPDKTIVM